MLKRKIMPASDTKQTLVRVPWVFANPTKQPFPPHHRTLNNERTLLSYRVRHHFHHRRRHLHQCRFLPGLKLPVFPHFLHGLFHP